MPQISVIIPVYNVKQYLNECLNSVLNQTFTDFELLLIDDGSTDDSSIICDEYQIKDTRITVIHKENAGQGVARNIGMGQVTGKYIIFLDSDDYWDVRTLEPLYLEAEKNQLDILQFSAESFGDGIELNEWQKNAYIHKCQNGVVKTGAESIMMAFDNNEYYTSPVLRLIKTNYLRESYLQFDEGVIHEDESFSFLTYIHAQRVECVGERLYKRRYRPGSTMTSKSNIRSAEGYAAAFGSLAEYYCNSESRLHDLYEKRMCLYLYTVLRMYHEEEKKKLFRMIVQPYLRQGLHTDISFSKENRIALKSLLAWQSRCAVLQIINKIRRKLSAVYHRVKKH